MMMSGLTRSALTSLCLMLGLLFQPPQALAQEQSIDLWTQFDVDGRLQISCYEGVEPCFSYEVRIEDAESGDVRIENFPEARTLTLADLDPARSYYLTVTGRDEFGNVVDTSPDEVLMPLDSYPSSMTNPGDLSLSLVTLDPGEFPFIYSSVKVDSAGEFPRTIFESLQWSVFEDGILLDCDITPPDSAGGVRIADIIIIGDNSGSMAPERAAVIANVGQFASDLQAAGVDFRLGLVRFGQSAGSGNPILVNGGSMTDNAQDFIDHYLNQWTASGSREPGLQAVIDAANGFPFRTGSQRHFLLITDEDSDGAVVALTVLHGILDERLENQARHRRR